MIETMLKASSSDMDYDEELAQMIRKACTAELMQTKGWCIEGSDDPLQQWVHCICASITYPEQGWKLHISADPLQAKLVLSRVLPILLMESSGFKVAASLRKLAFLNQGEGGVSQIGKFITIYPKDEYEAVQLASRLDEVTQGLSGPSVPSDRPLYPGSIVSYRYGGMASRIRIQTPIGKIEPAIRTPDGNPVPDRRLPRYEAPQWAVDPFVAAGIAVNLPEPNRLIGGKYLIISTISLSINHALYLAADLDQGRSCVIKGPGYAGRNNPPYATLYTNSRHEAEILARLAPDPHFPTPYDLIEQEDGLFLVMQDIEGKTINTYLTNLADRGQYLPIPQLIAWGLELCDIFRVIHEKGLVYGDMKSANVMIDTEGQMYLIDFDIAHEQGDENPLWRGRGTAGYMSPQIKQRQAATVADDIYALGVLLYFALTNANPSFVPDPLALFDRPVELLRPDAPASLKDIIARCLQHDPQMRSGSVDEFRAQLVAVSADDPCVSTLSAGQPGEDDGAQQRAHYRELAGRLLDTLCATAQSAPDQGGCFWISTHPLTYGLAPRDINTGNGGVVLALAELAAEFDRADAQAVLAEGARWLSTAPPIGPQPLPGLYVGEAGVGAALLRAGQVLHDEKLITAAIERGRKIASLPYASPDLFNGTAGRLRFHLLLWDETRESEHLQAAIACGEQLLNAATIRENHEVSWTIPEGYEEMSNQTLLGYAHGAAGIADALLDLFEITLDEQLLSLIQGAGRWLIRQALPALDDSRGLSWPKLADGPAHSAFWCHGAAGIACFLLHASQCHVIPEAGDIAARAARTVAYGTRWAGPTQCHGLAGNSELLLDMYQATGDTFYGTQAFVLGRLLETFAKERDGHLMFASDLPHVFTPDYQVGYGGVAVCLLRLSSPEYQPHQLSRKGFRYQRRDGKDL